MAQEVIVTELGTGKFAQEVKIGNHVLTADEPRESGGTDTGPNPYEFLMAGLGACTSITLRMYANFRNIPLEKTTVILTLKKVYAEDCENCENNSAKIDIIERRIVLQGNLTPEQRNKLLDIANKCPVHRTLTSGIKITTQLVN